MKCSPIFAVGVPTFIFHVYLVLKCTSKDILTGTVSMIVSSYTSYLSALMAYAQLAAVDIINIPSYSFSRVPGTKVYKQGYT
jgi:hypothetical protein